MIEEEELPSSKANDLPFSTTSEEQPCNNLNSTTQMSTKTPRKPGWEIKLTSNKAPKTVSADLDESNILQTWQASTVIHPTLKAGMTLCVHPIEKHG
ncbi:hypothetical protein O181_042934 [Austropuccinia psidii MF-1]|uniref:Uncharacterized protein n=1 Tax=Austropuccinia psidii MF-1 TaxID=1389203 RepID=A0A9Q3DHC1_9BASI|nr:hypothetical protein [Austropuccinia psidii MF-1]